MEDFRRTYLQLCQEGGLDPQESLLVQIQQNRVQGTRLDLSGQNLTLETCSVLARVLQRDQVFTEVLLSDCMLSEEGAKVLLSGLMDNQTVKTLNLKGNNLRSGGAEVLGKLLSRNRTLQRLLLEWNGLGVLEETFSLLCDGLACNSVLTRLDLRNNQVSHQGAVELGLALRRNTALQELDLRWNNVGLLGGRALLEALNQNQSLVQLEMAGNNVPSDTMRALEQAAGHNSDRRSVQRENRSRSLVLSKEIQTLREEKGRQFLSLMETIDRQRDDMGRSSRSTSIHMGQLQEALNERKSAVNSLTAKLQMAEAALALSEQKNQSLGELLTREKEEKEEQKETQSRLRSKDQEDAANREGKLLREIHNLTENNGQLRNKAEELEIRSKSQQQQIFELKQEVTNSTAELKMRLAQAEDRLESEKRRSKQALEDVDGLRQKEVEHLNRHLQESERVLQERIFKLEGQRLQLEEELSRTKAAAVTERAEAEEELGRVRAQARLQEQEQQAAAEEKLRSQRCRFQELQLQNNQQKQNINDLQARISRQNNETDALRRRHEELQQELAGKDQEQLAAVSRAKLELQEQLAQLQAETAAQAVLRSKVSALERELRGLSSDHQEALLDQQSQRKSLQEKLRLKELEIQRMKEDQNQRGALLQGAVLAYVQGGPLGAHGPP
ncbi:leucine-rich repeat-containing protein 45 [Cololabis saira]|uniref:leucine-rich repeat-containing protein 45 n=1 Tax=Cololabis saira TaxID=129043 RepID=UPI002AD34B2D|nr:leucine-rich repeat-containing protein 45 [Cololabis saira]